MMSDDTKGQQAKTRGHTGGLNATVKDGTGSIIMSRYQSPARSPLFCSTVPDDKFPSSAAE